MSTVCKDNIIEYSKFHNKHYNIVARLEERVTKHGTSAGGLTEEEIKLASEEGDDVETLNMLQLFSLAKRNPIMS